MPYIGNVLTSFAVETGNIADQAVTAPKLSATGGTNGQVLALDAGGNLVWTSDPAGQWVTSGSNIYFDTGNVGIGTTTPTSLLSVDGVGAFGLGSASAPSVSFNGDLNTGLYSPGADQVAISTNGTGRLFVDASGNVLMGRSTLPPAGWPVAVRDGLTAASSDNSVQTYLFGYSGTAGVGTYTNTNFEFRVNNSERMRLDTSGRLGLGSSSPVATNHIRGSGTSGQVTASWMLENASSGTVGMDVTGAAGSSIWRFLYGGGPFTGTNALTPALTIGVEGAAAGRVGVGTTSPQAKLHVRTGTDENLWVGSLGGSGAGVYLAAVNDATSLNVPLLIGNSSYTSFATGGTERARIDSSGKFLVGTDLDYAENVQAAFYGASNGGISLAAGTSGLSRLMFADATAGNPGAYVGSIIYSHVDDSLRFNVNGGAERARIDSSGRLLVGTSSTSSVTRAVIQGNSAGNSQAITYFQRGSANPTGSDQLAEIKFADSNGSVGAEIAAYSDDAWATNDYPGRLVFSTTADGASSPTERMRILQNGEILGYGVYNFTTSNAANVYVFSSGELRRSTSSSKYKQDIETLQDAYADALLNCRPVWYRSTCDKDNPNWGWWGFIAEEVAAIDPRLVHWKTIEVTYDEKGSAVETPCEPEPEGVAYDRFVPHLLNLIKRQQQAIETLEARVAALESA